MILALLGVAASAFAAEPRVEFRVEPRIEVLAVAALLGGQTSGADPAYEKDARAYFAPFKDHPAVAAVARAGKEALEAPELSDFAAKSRFSGFFAAHEGVYRRWRREAEAEARRGQSMRAVAKYLGEGAPEKVAFVLSGLLPHALETGYRGAVVRSALPRSGGPDFELYDLGRSPAHELAHLGMKPRIRERWDPDLEETLAFAVTFRAMKPDVRDRELPRYAPKVPRLSAVYDALGADCDTEKARAAYDAK